MNRALLAALCVTVVALPAQAARQSETKAITLRLISTSDTSKTIVDRAPKLEASKGDVYLVDSLLRNAAAQFGRSKGALVGSQSVIFRIVSASQADVRVEASLPGGMLQARGRTRLGYRLTFSVTGGTGRFARARGTGESRSLGMTSSRRLVIYRLQLPWAVGGDSYGDITGLRQSRSTPNGRIHGTTEDACALRRLVEEGDSSARQVSRARNAGLGPGRRQE